MGASLVAHVALALALAPALTSTEPAAASAPEPAALTWLDTIATEEAPPAMSARAAPSAVGAESEARPSPSTIRRARARRVAAPAPALVAETRGEASSGAGGSAVSGTPAPEGDEAEARALATSAGGASDARGSAARPAERARLLSWGRPCTGDFPAAAHAAHGVVSVQVEVGADGVAHGVHVIGVSPAGEGFARAARTCARRLRFRPARAADGHAIDSNAALQLRFDRG